jgi:hypothetical protein
MEVLTTSTHHNLVSLHAWFSFGRQNHAKNMVMPWLDPLNLAWFEVLARGGCVGHWRQGNPASDHCSNLGKTGVENPYLIFNCESCWMVWDHQDVITFDTDIYEGWWGKHLNRWACGSPACCMKRSYWILLFLNSGNIICAPNRWYFTNNSQDMGQTHPKHEGMRVWLWLTRQEWFLPKKPWRSQEIEKIRKVWGLRSPADSWQITVEYGRRSWQGTAKIVQQCISMHV